MYKINNFFDNDDINCLSEKGPFSAVEYCRDLSVMPATAAQEYFNARMGIRRRQLICDLSETQAGITVQAGAMQWMMGDVNATTGITGAGDFVKKIARSHVTKESAIKPEYKGSGIMALEPTYRHLVLLDVAEWGGGVLLDDGLFLACESTLKHKAVMRSNFSSALAGGEGLFNLCLEGKGVVCLESDCPVGELMEVELQNDVVKIDGNLAVAWSRGLEFTVERSGKTLLGSAASGEGLVNVYRGTGKLLMMPVRGSLQERLSMAAHT